MTLIFGIVFFILAKFGFPLITGMVDKRSERIAESIAKAKEAEEKLSTLTEQQNQMLEQTRLEQARILSEASEVRDNMIAKAREEAGQEAAKVIEQARRQISAEKEAALRDIRRQVSALSVEVAENLIRKELDQTSEQLSLIDKLYDEAAGLKDNS